MAKKEHKIGDTLHFNGVKLRCEKSTCLCEGCYFFENQTPCYLIGETGEKTGKCTADRRKDKTDVIFVKVEE